MNHTNRYSEHYAILALLFSCGIVGLLFFRGNQWVQISLCWLMMLGYLGWGVIHHFLRHDLTKTVVLEYFLVALIGGITIQATLIQR